MGTGGGYYQQKEVKKMRNKIKNHKDTCPKCSKRNTYWNGDTHECHDCGIEYDDGNRFNLIKQRVDRENYKIGWNKKDNEK